MKSDEEVRLDNTRFELMRLIWSFPSVLKRWKITFCLIMVYPRNIGLNTK